MDDRYARNRIQTSSWFNSCERRDFLGSEMYTWYARRQPEWKEVLSERYNARKRKRCRRREGKWWCPVIKEYEYLMEISYRGVHVLPYVLGATMIGHILGGEKSLDDHTWWRHGDGMAMAFC